MTPEMIRAADDSAIAARPGWQPMNTNELLAAGTAGAAHGHHLHVPLIAVGIVVLVALGYGAVRVTHRVRLARPRRPVTPVTRPEPPSPAPEPSPHPNGWAVETHALTKRFGATVAVDGVELFVPRGSAFGYLGPNGAGKTTLIRTLLGLTRANSGTMSLLSTPVPAQRRRALARVGAIVDEPRFHPHLTGRDNLRLLAAARGGDAAQRIAPSLARVGLADRAGDKVATYSMGMRQRLGVAACLLADPDLLMLDEPMNGLDPAGMHEMRAMIASLAGEGRTVVAFVMNCLVTGYESPPNPTTVSFYGVTAPDNLNQAGLQTWLLQHSQQVGNGFLPGLPVGPGPGPGATPTPAQVRSAVDKNIAPYYSDYTAAEISGSTPADNEMAKIGLWLELDVGIAFLVGLGFGSLTGQRTTTTIVLIALEIIVTPLLAHTQLPYFIDGQRLLIGIAMDQLRPAALAAASSGGRGGGILFGGGRGALGFPPMPTWAMISVIVGWIVVWSGVGAWRMMTRDA
jgi:ABC-type Na+ transport system ATPase subunit NatA